MSHCGSVLATTGPGVSRSVATGVDDIAGTAST